MVVGSEWSIRTSGRAVGGNAPNGIVTDRVSPALLTTSGRLTERQSAGLLNRSLPKGSRGSIPCPSATRASSTMAGAGGSYPQGSRFKSEGARQHIEGLSRSTERTPDRVTGRLISLYTAIGRDGGGEARHLRSPGVLETAALGYSVRPTICVPLSSNGRMSDSESGDVRSTRTGGANRATAGHWRAPLTVDQPPSGCGGSTPSRRTIHAGVM